MIMDNSDVSITLSDGSSGFAINDQSLYTGIVIESSGSTK